MKNSLKKLVLSGFFIALGFILPFFTGQIPALGNKLLPMHIPVLLCGFVCGWPYGLAVGFIVPLFRSIVFGMPPMFPIAMAMAFELAAYGFISGLLYKYFSRSRGNILVSLIAAMLGGRVVWGIVSYFLYGISGSHFTLNMFIAGAFINAVPGIIIQLILLPSIVLLLERMDMLENGFRV
ncbi:MAG: ECF transporter S component [Tissierellia bacterium]|nr:ECF transporter S component [Tissierellia bacterium]